MGAERVAFVTGGTGGLGTAIARRLHDAGITGAVSYMNGDAQLATWIAREREAGRTFHAFEVDVADYDSCQHCAARMLAEFGHVDVLVNNAGITRDATFVKMTKTMWDAVLRTNLDSMFNMTKPFVPGMIAAGFGRIVNIGSVNGSRGAFGQANYAAAKAGIHGFTKALALELARHGITVNTVAPGYLATAMLESVPKEVLDSKILPQIPVGRLGHPDEIAELIAFLCSDAGAFSTGAEFDVNGGMPMH
ncbi:acetoacetyl-CoA reductase [Burkholderia vietnamiensis]|uniref:acetoacetyl-CoA reductase n=1 Tax=Burkholderia vietnamiensis TaxID=60552 RepID=UPI000D78BEA4|nr:acetoacetyl-CoA reductase [Burkholderia vietnamiensis]GBH27490.1 beta-ketoacyl-ACP reductase [Burkholderia vietnamiensis]